MDWLEGENRVSVFGRKVSIQIPHQKNKLESSAVPHCVNEGLPAAVENIAACIWLISCRFTALLGSRYPRPET
jgi:hypothetical protein